MAGDAALTVYGNLTKDPELRFTQGGAAVVRFTVAMTPRFQDREGQWKEGDPLFMSCTAWRQLAENVATLNKGDRVVVAGSLRQRSWETDDGQKRSMTELTAEDVGLSVKFHPAESKRAEKSAPKPEDDPWASKPASDEPPF